jgi:triphosphoribosyl-dephospho-CoA synthase
MAVMSVGNRVRVAIEAECSAMKAGNVHPHASFPDLNHQHFLIAAQAIGARIDQCYGQSVGRIVLQSVHAMMDAVSTNTSLGTILLVAPLVVATNRLTDDLTGTRTFRETLRESLATLTPDDSFAIYEAIRIAKPGGLGQAASMDVRQSAPTNILDAMKLAAEWDDIALQYTSDFELVFAISRRLEIKQAEGLSEGDAIRCVQIELLSERVDSLIARKQGQSFAKHVQAHAAEVIASGPFGSAQYESAWHRFDDFLRDDSHRGNPGTIADLLAAALF